MLIVDNLGFDFDPDNAVVTVTDMDSTEDVATLSYDDLNELAEWAFVVRSRMSRLGFGERNV